MEFCDISLQRQQNQQLLEKERDSISDLVRHFGAMQAQDYAMAKWAVGCRLRDVSDADVDEAIASGKIVRTHVLRPTWHFACAEDIGWMLELTSRNIRGQMASIDKKLGLDEKIYNRSFRLIEKALGEAHLSRPEIMEILEYNGIRTHEYRSAHIMLAAEIEGIVVSGRRNGREHTYALMAQQVAKPRKLSKEEGLSELAKAYFASHGPATIKDFQWWSGLNLTDCKKGVAPNEKALQKAEIDGQTYYYSEERPAGKKSVHLLPAFDEFLIAYKDRSASLDLMQQPNAISSNGIFRPILVVDGQVCGLWKRSVKNDTVHIEIDMLSKIPKNRLPEIEEAAQKFAAFLGLEARLGF